jgi:hypothetical protein
MKLPPSLRARVLDFHPDRAAMPQTICKTPKELFDDFISEELPRLRALGPMAVAPPGSTSNVALLIEPRCHPCLEHVIRNAMMLLNGWAAKGSGGWQLQVFHGTDNLGFLREPFTSSELAHIQFVSLEVDNLSNLAHNELMCTHWLWSRAAAERVLIFQTDSLICKAGGIDAFQGWDYIGAPWRLDDLWCAGKPWLTSVGGNGGFSLRSRERTLACIDLVGYVRGQSEDVYYTEAMPKVGGMIADRAAGLAFSVESVWAPEPFAFHAAYKWLNSEQMAELLSGISRVYRDKERERESQSETAATAPAEGEPAPAAERQREVV